MYLFYHCMQQIRKKEFDSLVKEGYFNFLYDHPHDSTTIEFFSDSLYIFKFTSENKKYAELGKWNIDNTGYFSSILVLDEYGMPFELKILELGESSILKSKKGKISMTKADVNDFNSNKLIGTWVDPLDSFPSNMIEYEQGLEYMHPTFTFTDSIYFIRADDVMVNKSTYRVLKSSGIIILEEGQYYSNNPLIVITYLQNERLNLRIRDNMGWKDFHLVRSKKKRPNMI